MKFKIIALIVEKVGVSRNKATTGCVHICCFKNNEKAEK